MINRESEQLLAENIRLQTELQELRQTAESLTMGVELPAQNWFDQLFNQMNAASALHKMAFDEDGQPENYQFIRVNNMFEQLTGLKSDEIIGKWVLDVIPGLERSWIERYGAVVKNGTHDDFEDYSKDLDRYYSVRAYSVGKDHFVVTFIDVTDRKKAELTRIDRDRHMIDVVEGLNGVVYRCENDSFWTMIFLSAGTKALTGYRPEDIIGNKLVSFIDLIHPDDIEMVGDIVIDALSRDERYKLEYRIYTKDGEEKWVYEQGQGIKNSENKLSHLEGYIFDITDRKKMEIEIVEKNREIAAQNEEYLSINEELNTTIDQMQQINSALHEAKVKAEESDRLKSAFLANMSHEIRTPMNSIIGFSALMTERGIGRTKREYFSRLIASAGEHLLRIIDDILDIAKIESNQLAIETSHQNLNSLLKEIYMFHQQGKLLKQKNHLKLILQNEEMLNGLVIDTDPIRFMQVFGNLISNAIKNTKEGIVEFGLDKVDQENDRLVFFVRDTGIGIPKEYQKKIFERFMQVNGLDLASGTGLGLSITQGIIHLMKGDIWLESEEGKGTVFYFSIPYSSDEYVEKIPEMQKRSFQIPDLTERLVYIAEDDFPSFLYLREVLDITNARIKHAENGLKLIELVKQEEPDLLLVDINMPVMNGMDAVSELRGCGYKFPIIAQTAYALLEERESCLKAGCSAYISKPIDANLLFELINQSTSSYAEN